jgi:hypothetical protein
MALDINNYDPAFRNGAQTQTDDIADASITKAKLASGISGAAITALAGTTSAYAGGGTSNGFTVTGLLSTDTVSAVIRASTNAVAVAKAVPTTNTLTITFSADPGAGTTVDYIVARASS